MGRTKVPKVFSVLCLECLEKSVMCQLSQLKKAQVMPAGRQEGLLFCRWLLFGNLDYRCSASNLTAMHSISIS